jgi:hypothetical protein
MNPTISKELKKATEELQTKMLAMQTEEAKMLKLKTAFVNESDPAKREKLKKSLVAQHKILKAVEAAADKADAEFHRILATEPEEDLEDLLDHKLQEHAIRMRVRRLVKESFKTLNRKK